MKQLKVRFADKSEEPWIENQLRSNPLNEFDPDILDYPTLQVLCSYGDGYKLYMPVQRALVMESIGPNATPQAVRDLTKAAELVASSHGIKELYFLDGKGGIAELAQHHGFEEVPYRVFRLKL